MAVDYLVRPIAESEEELLARLSHPEYFAEKIEKLKSGSSRMIEVLAVRSALKDLFQGVEQQVLYTTEGKPYLTVGQAPCISISHTKGYVAVIRAEHPVGIDIERRGTRVERVVSHFLKPEELSLLSEGVDEEKRQLSLHLAWSAKEAAFKVLGREFYDLQHLTTVTEIDWENATLSLSVSGQDQPLLVHFEYTEDYVLAYC